ncbi:MAG: pilus assembly protein N-terminal domain-containing protein [Firmicutes bacterium]|nr:pilus assembly protein N-terminal domain-containing protein [Bacillota bacterium]
MFTKKTNCRILGLLLLIEILFSLPTSAVQTTPATLPVVVGESRVLTVNEVSRVAIADDKVADVVVVSPSEIILNGKEPGVTTLHIWEKGGRKEFIVKVYVDNSTLAAEIAEAINDPAISVRVLRQTVFLEGQVDSEFKSARAEKIAQAYSDQVVNLLRLPLTPTKPEAAPAIAEKQPEPAGPDLAEVAQELVAYLGEEDFQAKVYGNGILLEGTVPSEEQRKRIEAVANFFADQTGADITVVANVNSPQGPKVALQVKVVELSTEVMDSVGLSWGSLYNGGVIPFELMFSEVKIGGPIQRITPIAAKLEMLVQDGDARVLAAPSLVTNSGEEATFLAGGEIPVPVPSGENLSIIWKEYGVKLSMLPRVYDGDMINLEVYPEVSSLDMTNAVKLDSWVIPALKTRRTKTKVDLRAGETLVIGGLISNEQAKMVQKVPILGDIPILGQLFRSTEFKDGQTQLVIMVTPQILNDEEPMDIQDLLSSELHGEVADVFPELSYSLLPPVKEKGSADNDSSQDQAVNSR